MKKHILFLCLLLCSCIFTANAAPVKKDTCRITLHKKDSMLAVDFVFSKPVADTIKPAPILQPAAPAENKTGSADLLLRLLTGALLGMVGQGIRMVVGLKKQNETGDVQDTSRIMISLVLGLIVGAVAGILIIVDNPANDLSQSTALTAIIAAGYAGTDFIEGFMRKSMPAAAPNPVPVPNPLVPNK